MQRRGLTANAVIVFRVSRLISEGMTARMKFGTLRAARVGLGIVSDVRVGYARADVEGA